VNIQIPDPEPTTTGMTTNAVRTESGRLQVVVAYVPPVFTGLQQVVAYDDSVIGTDDDLPADLRARFEAVVAEVNAHAIRRMAR